jgi:hypothetical protein
MVAYIMTKEAPAWVQISWGRPPGFLLEIGPWR